MKSRVLVGMSIVLLLATGCSETKSTNESKKKQALPLQYYKKLVKPAKQWKVVRSQLSLLLK